MPALLGGLEPLAEALRMLRRSQTNLLFVHSGDFFPAKLQAYSRELPRADTRFWNRLGLEAAVLGNYEFDYGPEELRLGVAEKARYFVYPALA